MRKLYILFLVLCFTFFTSACGTSDEDQEWIEQYQERQSQVEEVSPRLESALYGVFDNDKVDVRVSNISGTIDAFVEVLVDNANRSDFGTIISALATRFFELPAEYNDYDFGHINFYYYYTTRNGRKLENPSITYTLDIGEDAGRLFDSKSNLSMQFMTPEEAYYYLSGVSPDAKSIPALTLAQEALVGENYFEPVPSEIFSTTAEENGLGDTAYYAEGEIVSRIDVSGYDTIQVATPGGDLYISAAFIDLPDVSVGDPITVFFVYAGFSNSLNSPCGIYVYSE